MDRALKQGFTLVELLVSVAILTLLLTVVSKIVVTSKNVTTLTESRENAFNLVNTKISELLALPQDTIQEICENQGKFKRCWEIGRISESFGSSLLATVTVTWSENGKPDTCSLSGIVQGI